VIGALGPVVRAAVTDRFVRQRLRPFLCKPNRADLLTVTGFIDDGRLTPVVDRTYPMAETADGLRHVERGHTRGKVVITVP
jgi:NADPH:quinone reductase-like Zn-dependent oxidoreductase